MSGARNGAEITVAQAAKRLSVTTTTVYRYIESGLVLAYQLRPNSPYRVIRESVDDLLRRTRGRTLGA